jgi:hypothetical protein
MACRFVVFQPTLSRSMSSFAQAQICANALYANANGNIREKLMYQ